MSKWEADCTRQFNPEDWDMMLDNLHKCTKSFAIREAGLKFLTMWYYAPFKLQAIFPGTSGLCVYGCPLLGSYKHIFWDCEQLSLVWSKIHAIASAISDTLLKITIQTCVIGTPIPGILRKEGRLIHAICVCRQYGPLLYTGNPQWFPYLKFWISC